MWTRSRLPLFLFHQNIHAADAHGYEDLRTARATDRGNTTRSRRSDFVAANCGLHGDARRPSSKAAISVCRQS
ncbi:hypothetical protein F5141DRAFT_767080 [Pisolithus sp. B1]|nr:hypothetical protein F5141DRAFT_767080 [Pisolithus sp. B1]